MKNYLLIVAVLITAISFSQNQDFTFVSLEIKPHAVALEKPLISYISSQDKIPYKFELNDIRTMNYSRSDISLVYKTNGLEQHQKDPSITIVIPTKEESTISFWGSNGNNGRNNNTDEVTNIAYQPALQGSLFDAYCTAVYAARSGN